MVAEAACASKPWTVIPMVVTGVQDFIAAGQFRSGEQLFDPQQALSAGFLDAVVAVEDLLPSARAMAEQLKKINLTAHANTKLKARKALLDTLDAAIELDKQPLW